ncbi:MAG: prolyl oligopeptidase family serine peptidase [Planctomycetota bacterium]
MLKIPVREPGTLRRSTFRSAVDGSVQEYCVLPPRGERETGEPPRLLLSLHGAGVAAWGQAASYAALPDFWHVAATNRRPFGFDWQDWGRIDLYEVRDRALALSGVSRRHVVLGGHSMGGHGVWHLAANDPDGFAAIAPSAAWRSFDTYGGRPAGALRALWHAADAASDTEALADNLAGIPTYILHGEKDESVPVEEALAMRDLLAAKGAPLRFHIEPGQGHWWDAGIGPGTDCLAWPGFYELFRASALPPAPRAIAFASVDPVVDADHYWVHVAQPLAYGAPLSVRGAWIPEERRIELATANVGRLRVDAPGWNGVDTIVVDGAALAVDREGGSWWLRRDEGAWVLAGAPPAAEKRPGRSGPFKRAFDRRFLLVVPTAGTAEENERALESARWHGEGWWYRGNGDAPIVTDEEVLAAGFAGQNLLLFGNRDTNRAWAAAVPALAPIDVARGAVRVGERTFAGGDLGVLAVLPRAGDEAALVGLLATSGPPGERVATTLAPFVSGVGIPDYAVYATSVLRAGDGGVCAAGWLSADWGLGDGAGGR